LFYAQFRLFELSGEEWNGHGGGKIWKENGEHVDACACVVDQA
jgi:hypothetical protein